MLAFGASNREINFVDVGSGVPKLLAYTYADVGRYLAPRCSPMGVCCFSECLYTQRERLPTLPYSLAVSSFFSIFFEGLVVISVDFPPLYIRKQAIEVYLGFRSWARHSCGCLGYLEFLGRLGIGTRINALLPFCPGYYNLSDQRFNGIRVASEMSLWLRVSASPLLAR